ncbi:hypothetical protein [Catellatospora chokoriensis]|uniref:Uncharacterized protein n=1 Tax=Catellatospora chokoriensis TaxID=310353 RepID=A0A8J3NRS3_9ACTN|nr:hypothetical protein [Catellatospora chokoriensis]GIF90477.1 hypothetical protein Cch02nite_39210 [Catellatospora chokoriensis]
MATPEPDPAALAELIHTVRQAATTHEQQLAALIARTRRAIITAVAAGTICYRGADDVLAEWDMPGLPKLWPVEVEAPVAYRRRHPDSGSALTAHHTICDILAAALPDEIDIGPTRHEHAAPVGDDGQEFDVSATVVLTVPVTADGADTAIRIAQDRLAEALTCADEPMQVTVDLDRAQWDTDRPRDAALDPDEDAPAHIAYPTAGWDLDLGPEQQLAQAREREDAARLALPALRAAIRTRAIRAVADDLGHLDDPAQRVDRFLADIGLDPLPRAWLVCIEASTTVTVTADHARHARALVADAAQARWTRRHERVGNDDAFTDTPRQSDDGRWQVTCNERLRVWARTADEHTAADIATRLARAHLDNLDLPQLHGHRLVVTGTAQVVDPVLDPDRD